MLQRLGCWTDVAANGQKAIDMIKASFYDLVFMDCQLPVLDGYEATAEIRRGEAPGVHLPIVCDDRQCHPGRPRALPRSRHGRLHLQAREQSEIIAMLKRYLPAMSSRQDEPVAAS